MTAVLFDILEFWRQMELSAFGHITTKKHVKVSLLFGRSFGSLLLDLDCVILN